MSHLSRQRRVTLATIKLASARVLLDQRYWTDAYYLAGYAVEFALKAVIARQFPADCLPDKALVQRAYTHDLEALLRLARVEDELRGAGAEAPMLQANWTTVSQWSEASRYEMSSRRRPRAPSVRSATTITGC